MKAATAQKAVGDLGNVLAPSDLRQEYFQRALTRKHLGMFDLWQLRKVDARTFRVQKPSGATLSGQEHLP